MEPLSSKNRFPSSKMRELALGLEYLFLSKIVHDGRRASRLASAAHERLVLRGCSQGKVQEVRILSSARLQYRLTWSQQKSTVRIH